MSPDVMSFPMSVSSSMLPANTYFYCQTQCKHPLSGRLLGPREALLVAPSSGPRRKLPFPSFPLGSGSPRSPPWPGGPEKRAGPRSAGPGAGSLPRSGSGLSPRAGGRSGRCRGLWGRTLHSGTGLTFALPQQAPILDSAELKVNGNAGGLLHICFPLNLRGCERKHAFKN